MDIKSALQAVVEKRDLSTAEMSTVMHSIMTGAVTPAQIGGFLVGLRMKGETVEEITAAAQVMRELVTPVMFTHPHAVDIVGTGGDGMHTFNISTASAFVVAAAGGKVAKHGNRSVSSRCGSADVLELLGINLEITPEQIARCIRDIGIGFMFAPRHHPAMKHAIGPRREMGIRTIFNLLGPLTNPANVPNQVIGVFSRAWVEPVVRVMQRLGSHHVLVTHSEDGLDEISIAAPTFVAELHQGHITMKTITPEEFGYERATLAHLQVQSCTESVALLRAVLDNNAPPAVGQVVALNAGAAIYAANLVDTFAEGVKQAQMVIEKRMASDKLTDLVRLTQSFSAES